MSGVAEKQNGGDSRQKRLQHRDKTNPDEWDDGIQGHAAIYASVHDGFVTNIRQFNKISPGVIARGDLLLRSNIEILRECRAFLNEAEASVGLGAHQIVDGVARAFEIDLVDHDTQ
jgi:hypothetical protein